DDRLLRGDSAGFERFRRAVQSDRRLVAALDTDFDVMGGEADEGQRSVDDAKQCLEHAHQLGAPIICLRLKSAGAALNPEAVKGVALEVRQLLPRARELGIRVAVETGAAAAAPAGSVLAL